MIYTPPVVPRNQSISRLSVNPQTCFQRRKERAGPASEEEIEKVVKEHLNKKGL